MAKSLGLPVVRDYIPEPKDASTVERDRFERARLNARGQSQRDFIPDKDHVLRPPSGSAKQADEALDRAMARQATAAREDFQAAVTKLRNLNVAQAIDAINQAPASVQDMMLVAETLNGARSSILQRFPEVDPFAVERWEAINSGAPDPALGGVATEATSGTADESVIAEVAKDE